MHTIDWQPLINAVAAFIVLAGPGVAALVVALGNKAQLKDVPKRAGDRVADPSEGKGSYVKRP
jgi:hypothetical protein